MVRLLFLTIIISASLFSQTDKSIKWFDVGTQQYKVQTIPFIITERDVTVGGVAYSDSIYGGTASGNNLNLFSTMHATKGNIFFNGLSTSRIEIGGSALFPKLGIGGMPGADGMFGIYRAGTPEIVLTNTNAGAAWQLAGNITYYNKDAGGNTLPSGQFRSGLTDITTNDVASMFGILLSYGSGILTPAIYYRIDKTNTNVWWDSYNRDISNTVINTTRITHRMTDRTVGNNPGQIEFATRTSGGAITTAMTIDGNQRVGFGIAPNVQLDMSKGMAVRDSTPAQIIADQNDYSVGTVSVLRLNTDAARNITGFASGTQGRFLYIFNVGSFNIVLIEQSALSTAANRIITGAGDVTIPTNRSVTLWYDSTTQRWRRME